MAEPAQGGGVAEALVSLDAQLAKITKAIVSNDQIPDEIKGDFQQAQDSLRSGLDKLTKFAGGESPEAEVAEGGGAVAPEAGAARGAVPMSPAGVRR